MNMMSDPNSPIFSRAFAKAAGIVGISNELRMAQTDQYKVRGKVTGALETRHTCFIGVSYQNENHQGAKLDAMLNWAQNNFRYIVISVSDTLHRYNLISSGMGIEEALDKSKQYGDVWESNNRDILKKYPIMAIHSWDDWRYHPTFLQKHQAVRELHSGLNPVIGDGFAEAVDRDVEAFLNRANRAGLSEAQRRKIASGSTNFLIEEVAGYAVIADHYYAARVYPGAILESFKFFKETTPVPGLETLSTLPHVALSFDKKKAPAPGSASKPSRALGIPACFSGGYPYPFIHAQNTRF